MVVSVSNYLLQTIEDSVTDQEPLFMDLKSNKIKMSQHREC